VQTLHWPRHRLSCRHPLLPFPLIVFYRCTIVVLQTNIHTLNRAPELDACTFDMWLSFLKSKLINARFVQRSARTSLRKKIIPLTCRLIDVLRAEGVDRASTKTVEHARHPRRLPTLQLSISALSSRKTCVQNAPLLLLCCYHSTLLVFWRIHAASIIICKN